MNHLFLMKRIHLVLCLLGLFLVEGQAQTVSPVQQAFLHPDAAARPWCFWYWMHGCVSREGIRADLQAMHDIGLEGAYLMPIRGKQTPSMYEPVVEQLTPEWWQLIRFTLEEADKQQLKLAMHSCDGFALAGGPWITPELSMQQLVWTETRVKGGRMLHLKLLRPETREGYYRDIAVFAYPAPSGVTASESGPFRITSVDSVSNLDFLADKTKKGVYRNEQPCWIQYEYKQPFLCRSIVTNVNGTNYQCHRFRVEASDDGIHFRFVAQLETPRHGWQNTAADVTHAIPPTQARYFRFYWTKEGSEPGAEDLDNAKWKPILKLTGIRLSAQPEIDQFEGKNGSVWRLSPATTGTQLPETLCVPENQLINLTACLTKEGQLNWKAPKGNWTILRMGHTSTGQTNATGGAGAGLECDKFNPAAVQLQFDRWFGQACAVAGPELVSRVLNILHIDSWECGSQNWSVTFPQAFEQHRGYSLIPYLPVMAGIPVGSVRQSEQVLHDVRQTISELINAVFFKTMVDAAHAKGCQVSAESVAPTMMSDGMLHDQTVDLPMGEFWLNSPTHDKPNDLLDAISGAHVYGKNVIQAEGFTELAIHWDETPASLKPLLDRQFALGINRLVFHVFTHNPYTGKQPGMTLDGIGLYFQRDQTWWKPAKAWIDYITRCQALLQTGHPVADIAVFNGLELPRRAILPDRLVPSLPGIFGDERVKQEQLRVKNSGVPMTESPAGVRHTATITTAGDWVNALQGYAYDTFNPDVLFRLAKADHGRLTLPDGASYKLLIVPLPHAMAPDRVTPYQAEETQLREVLRKLLKADVLVLTPDSLAEDLARASMIPWIYSDFSPLGLKRDVDVSENGQPVGSTIAWTHRADKDLDVYFISNQQNNARQLAVTLRVAGKVPELYDPVTGIINDVPEWVSEKGCTSFQLNLPPYASMFVVFERPAAQTAMHGPSQVVTALDCQPDAPWSVTFDTLSGGRRKPVSFDRLVSWTELSDTAIQYYSGTAVYRNTIQLNAPVDNRLQYWLNLGQVADLAEVFLNGQACGATWTPPYRVNVTKALKQGSNQLEIRVSNTWFNRLVKEAALPVSARQTWTNANYPSSSNKLLKAGLLGPLQLESAGMPLPKPVP